MIEEKDIELIEQYLGDSLDAEERTLVEQRLASDPEFKRRVEMMRELNDMYSSEAEDFRALLERTYQEYEQEKPQTSFVKQYWLVAASVTIALLIAAYFLFLSNAADLQQLYAENFSLPPDNLTVRTELPEQELINAAMENYTNGQHQQASVLFAQALEAQPDSIPILFYSAVNHMALEEMEQAVSQLQEVTAQGNSSYLMPARWYLALVYLQMNQQAEAERVLIELQNSSSSYADKAEELLEEFD
ncbi:tetratricopeptide repeat protein [Catalinimonas sp. 4WD22]|uniref:tetratricopeptide repeat protein n=1 Tax=Catalinimonas locisalis TaxID=3133978 RepID=UPI0031019E1E